MAQYDFYVWENPEFAAEQRRISKIVLDCAAAAGFATVDMYDDTERAIRTRGKKAIYRTWHPGPDGYRLIAEAIAAELSRRHMPPR